MSAKHTTHAGLSTSVTAFQPSPSTPMGLSDWFRKKTPLQMALARGVASGKLSDELGELDEVPVRSRADGEAICEALGAFNRQEITLAEDRDRAFRAIAMLFQKVEDSECDAFEVLRNRGLPLLRQSIDFFAAGEQEKQSDEVLVALKI